MTSDLIFIPMPDQGIWGRIKRAWGGWHEPVHYGWLTAAWRLMICSFSGHPTTARNREAFELYTLTDHNKYGQTAFECKRCGMTFGAVEIRPYGGKPLETSYIEQLANLQDIVGRYKEEL